MNSSHRIYIFVVMVGCTLGTAASAYNDVPVPVIVPTRAFFPLAQFNAGIKGIVDGGQSYDPDNGSPYCCDKGIAWHDWTFWPSATGVSYSNLIHSAAYFLYSSVGKKYAFLDVTDDDDPAATGGPAQCDIWVFQVDLSIASGFIGVGRTTSLSMAYAPANLYAGYKELSADIFAMGAIEVLQGQQVIISASDPKETWALPGPATVTVRGSSPGQGTLTLRYTPDGQVYPGGDPYNGDSVTVTVVETDLDIPGVSDGDEETVGGFVALNDDDDNGDGTPDKDQLGPHTEDDLRGIGLGFEPSWLQTGIIKLEATAGASLIRVWSDASKTYIVFPSGGQYYAQWDLSTQTLPWSLGVEGCVPSGALRNVELTLSYIMGGSVIHDDKVRMTVVDVDFVQHPNQVYGFDDYTNPFYPQKSVKADGSDVVRAEITPASAASNVYFVRTTGSSVDASPSPATTSPETVTFTGNDEGFSVVHAMLGSSGLYGVDAAVIGASAYFEDSYSVAVRVVHETSYNSSDPYTGAQLETYLNDQVYNQAVVNWTTVTKLPAMTVHFDLNNDGKLDMSSWRTAEQEVIISNCDPGGFEQVVFIVDHPNPAMCGGSQYGVKYAFVFPDESPDERQTTAHELGHAAFYLDDLDSPASADHYNLMWHDATYDGNRLRKSQWGIIQSGK
jgi:hypothetical protein